MKTSSYCHEEANTLISAICESTPALNEPIGHSPEMYDEEYDIHINAVTFTQAIVDYKMECSLQSSIESISSNNSADVYHYYDSPFKKKKTN